jgi:hypothetical protein
VQAQAKKINARIVDLIARENVSPGDVVVLVGDTLHKADCYGMLTTLPLPKSAVWAEEGCSREITVLIDTIQRFKGLVSAVMILWGPDGLDLKSSEELLYVGMSRAKSI